ncbi:MAG: hypothetical protein ACLQBQ_12400 [Smithella sp.]
MKENDIIELIEKFDTDREFLVSRKFPDRGYDPMSTLLHRAAYSQFCGDEATVKLYGMWASTIRDNIRQTDVEIENDNSKETHRLLRRAANSLLAFAELQAHFDNI